MTSENDRDDDNNMNHINNINNNNNNNHDNDNDDHDHHNHDDSRDNAGDEEINSSSSSVLPKTSFDFHSIRLMHEYMLQQQLSKMNGGNAVTTTILEQHHQGLSGESIVESASTDTDELPEEEEDDDDDEEEPLPLIPEIELITPNEEANVVGSLTGLPDSMTGGGGGGDINSGSGYAGAPPSDLPLTQLREYQCPHCYQIFGHKQTLKDHLQRVHGSSTPVYECSNCKKTYFYKRFLEKHIRRGRCVKKRRNQT